MVQPLRAYECMRACVRAILRFTRTHTAAPSFSPPSNGESRDRVYIFSSRRRALFTARRGYFSSSSSSFFAIYAGNYFVVQLASPITECSLSGASRNATGNSCSRGLITRLVARFVQFGYHARRGNSRSVARENFSTNAREELKRKKGKGKERKGKKERERSSGVVE